MPNLYLFLVLSYRPGKGQTDMINVTNREIQNKRGFKRNNIEVIRYSPEYKDIWNEFLADSKNGIFLFNRDYMEYHSDRFVDYSLMFFEDNKLLAILPANIEDNILYSHKGLTHGGIISDINMKIVMMLEIFDSLKEYLKQNRVNKVIYKAIPYIYHILPADEDLYALYLNDAKIVAREPSSAIYLQDQFQLSKSRVKVLERCLRKGVEIKESNNYDEFMGIMIRILREKYNTVPTHTSEEMKLLASRFPQNIKLYGAFQNDEMIAGDIIYENKNVVHAQYGTNNDIGRKLRAMESIDYYIFMNTRKKFFDFGISTENRGRCLNVGLIEYKEGCGARTITYDTYEMDIK